MNIRRSVVILLLCTLLGSIYLTFFKTEPPLSLSAFADCFDKNSSTATCIKQTVEQLLKTHTTAELMHYIVATTSPLVITQECHVISHSIGKQTLLTKSSMEDALAQCTNDCDHGCVHGVVGAEVSRELGEEYSYDDDIAHSSLATIKQIGSKYCLQSSSLCHAIGHVLFISTQSYADALHACDAITIYKESCLQGVFMESLGGKSSLAFSTTSLVTTHDDFLYPCNTVEAPYQHACFQYLSFFQVQMLAAREIEATSTLIANVVQACKSLNTTQRSYCFEGLAQRGVVNFFTSLSDIETFCDSLSDSADKYSCMVGYLNMLEENHGYTRATNYCLKYTDKSQSNPCYGYYSGGGI